MKYRKKLSKKYSKKNFRKGTKVKGININNKPIMRGGIRL